PPPAPTSPICSQPLPLPEPPSAKPPTNQSQSFVCTPSSNPLSPICAQALPCLEPSSPLSSSSPVTFCHPTAMTARAIATALQPPLQQCVIQRHRPPAKSTHKTP